jgi:undecaprenyl diphosphate synthase
MFSVKLRTVQTPALKENHLPPEMRARFVEVVERDSRDARLLERINWERLPRHVAIIMDGNGRWAAQRGQARIAGHRAGVEAVRATVDTSARLGLGALTLYAFSTENWKRPRPEVNALMRMLKHYLRQELDEIHRQNIRFQAIGRIEGLSGSVRRELDKAMERTQTNTGTILSVALNYGGRAEIVDACRRAVMNLAAENLTTREIVERLDEQAIERELYTRSLPELDLLIRTSGELRISNFLLWQAAYSEIYVTDVLWPDFRRAHLLEAIIDYQRRERRFGGIQTTVISDE